MKLCNFVLFALLAATAVAQQGVEVVKVVARPVERLTKLPGELLPYQKVAIHAKVTAFVEKVNVDRGSVVKEGQLLATLVAPELVAQRAEAEAKVDATESSCAQAEAKIAAAESTYERLTEAYKTPGAVAGNDLTQSQKEVQAASAAFESCRNSVLAARKSLDALKQLETYLQVSAPFSGVITERIVHPGALVGPSAGPSSALFELEQLSQLRLVVAVPETDVAGIVKGARVRFQCPAHPGEAFSGVVSRIGGSMDSKTRTMPVELDVANTDGKLAPGMYPEITWPVRTNRPSLLVPPSSIVTTTERTFVIRVRGGKTEWVNVARGVPVEDLMEIFGPLNPDDQILKRATDEIREGTSLTIQTPGK